MAVQQPQSKQDQKWVEYLAASRENAKVIGSAFASLKGTKITKDVLTSLVTVAIALWTPSRGRASKAHHGRLEVQLPSGPFKLGRKDGTLVDWFLNVHAGNEAETAQSGQTIQRLLQVIGALYARYKNDTRSAVEALTAIIPVSDAKGGFTTTPKGLLDLVKAAASQKPETHGFFGCLVTGKRKSDVLSVEEKMQAAKAMVDKIIAGLGLVALTADEASRVSTESPWLMVSRSDIFRLEKTVRAARARFNNLAAKMASQPESEPEIEEVTDAPEGVPGT